MASVLSPAQVPPVAERRAYSVTRFGERLDDPYFWMRDRGDPAVRAYLEAENTYAESMLAPEKEVCEGLYREMLGRIKQTDLTVPFLDRGFFYYTRTEEGEQYPIHCRKRGSLEASEEVLLDLNQLALGKPFMALGEFDVTDDGKLLAYSTDETGFRDYVLEVKDLVTGAKLPLRIERSSSAAWTPDGAWLFYVTEDDAKRPSRLWRHRLGSEQHDLVYEETDEAFRVGLNRSRSGAWLMMQCASHTTSETWLLPADTPTGEWRRFAPRLHQREYDLDHQGRRWVMRINDTGRNFRVVAVPVDDWSPEAWEELLPHREQVMVESVDCFATHLVVSERDAGLPRLRLLDVDGRSRHVPFPESVCDAWLGPNPEYDSGTLRYHYQSLVTPMSVFDYAVASGDTQLLKQTEVLGGYDPSQYESDRRWATAADGTRIPISIVWRRDRSRNRGPLYLTGYGAYGFSYPIVFSSNRLSLLDRGFAVAIAHIRGGSDLGKPWHDGGRMGNKRNTFTDFVAAAEYLVGEGWTSPENLVIEGGSAGGLLMGAVINLRPDLFRVVLAQVPFVDVINTMSDPTLPLTVGEFEEWGNPMVEEQYRWMREYCPYSNLRPGSYPAMLVRTSFNDSQVMYWEPAKYVARLRTFKTDTNPLLLLTNMGAGHGGASGRYDRLREIATDYGFILAVLSGRSSAVD
ncbi:MAG TPA: S9 family peptidase [Gemmatimonadales bacterium]